MTIGITSMVLTWNTSWFLVSNSIESIVLGEQSFLTLHFDFSRVFDSNTFSPPLTASLLVLLEM